MKIVKVEGHYLNVEKIVSFCTVQREDDVPMLAVSTGGSHYYEKATTAEQFIDRLQQEGAFNE